MLSLRPLRTCRLQDVLKYIGEEAPAQHLPRSARGQHKPSASTRERPVPGSHRKARLSQHESTARQLRSAPLPAVPAHPFERSHSGPRREGGRRDCCHTPLSPNTNSRGLSARFPNPGGSRCVVQPGPERTGGRPPTPPVPPDGRTPIPWRAGVTGPPALPPRPRLSSHKADGNAAAGTGPERGGRGEQGTATAAARRFPSGTAIGATPPAALPPATTARPALRHRPPPGHTFPARAPGHARTHPRSDTETRTHRHGQTDNTGTRAGAPVSLRVTVSGGSGGRRGSARSLTVTGRPVTAAPQPGGPARAPAPGLTAEVVDELGVAGAARLPGHR